MNSNYQNDVNSSLKYCRIFLGIIGMWPLINGYANKVERFTSTLLIVVSVTSTIFVLIPGGYSFFYVTELELKIQILGPVCFCFACLLKYCCFGAKASAIKYCIERIKEDWKFMDDEEHRAIMTESMIVAHKSIIVFSAQMYFSSVSYCIILPHWSNPILLSDNITYKPLINPGLDLILGDVVARYYNFIYLVHCIFGFISVTIDNSVCGVVLSFVAHACGMFQIQVARLQHLVDGTKDKRNRLAVIVHEHTEVLRYADSVSKALQEIFFFDILTSSIAICALEYLCVMAWKNGDLVGVVTYGAACISLGFNMFVICYVGEVLLEEVSSNGERFGEATYNIRWFDLPQNKKLDLILLIAISKYPPKLSGGKIFEISINTFTTCKGLTFLLDRDLYVRDFTGTQVIVRLPEFVSSCYGMMTTVDISKACSKLNSNHLFNYRLLKNKE
ncbi:unnamed protein product [Xylocopa violacea]|uniref:Odorant receptor n=1 Tax=Xylocopa violacea TaxID=135666 RepID=A0ABP1N6N8_XYLVO